MLTGKYPGHRVDIPRLYNRGNFQRTLKKTVPDHKGVFFKITIMITREMMQKIVMDVTTGRTSPLP
jgi:hypothetical protein